MGVLNNTIFCYSPFWCFDSLELYRDSAESRCQDFSVSIDNRDMHNDIT